MLQLLAVRVTKLSSGSPGAPHLDAWKRFNRAVGADGSVGIWHETYIVDAGRYECIYGNMPKWGLGLAATHLPVNEARGSAKRRMGIAGEPAVPGYENPP